MHLNLSQQMKMSLQQKLAPHMIQSMEILQLQGLALQERIEQALEDNPLLERESATETDEDGVELQEEFGVNRDEPVETEQKELVVDNDHNNEADFERLLEMAEDWPDDNVITSGRSSNFVSDQTERQNDLMANAEQRPQTLCDSLIEQLGFFDLSPVEKQFAEYLIYNLDEEGRLPTTLAELSQVFPGRIGMVDAERVLRLVQKLDPPGIAARDLRECWLLQIGPDTPHHETLITLLTHHMDDLAHRRWPVIQRKTGYSVDDIKAAIDVLESLNPFPGRTFQSRPVQRVTPDLIVEKNSTGKYEVRLVDEYTPSLRISPRYASMLRNGADAGTREFIKRKLEAAKWLIESIEQRNTTMLRVAQSVVDFQFDFLEYGPEHIAPLKMQQIADVVHVHVTTVSRAVNDKWIQTPRGLYPLKRFFAGGTQTSDGEEVALDIVRIKLKEMIDRENKDEPLSDEDLMKAMAVQGYPLARRTVTKYRKMMNIPSSRQRKAY